MYHNFVYCTSQTSKLAEFDTKLPPSHLALLGMPAPDARGAAPANQRRHSTVAPTPTILPSTAHLPSATTATSSASAPAAAQQDALSVILVTGGYDNTIRFWEAWSGVCSRTLNHQEHASLSVCCLRSCMTIANSDSSTASQSIGYLTGQKVLGCCWEWNGQVVRHRDECCWFRWGECRTG